MTHLILGLFHALLDVVRAVVELLARRRTSHYVSSVRVRAPREQVWALLVRRDITYALNGMRIVNDVAVQGDGVHLARVLQGEQVKATIAYRYEVVDAPTRLAVRYVPDHSSPRHGFGDDDTVTISLADDGHATNMTYSRQITHRRLGTRLSAPLGVRSATYLTRLQCEVEAGLASPRQSLVQQIVWTILAFLSFAWLLDWRLALAVMAIIAVHEAGHALAMLRYGLGVHVVSFVPFIGGVAAPRRYYESEWQRGMVALAGVGLSLPISLALLAVADSGHHPNLAAVALLALIINGLNLVPFPSLDGSVVVSILLQKLHPLLNTAFTILMFGVFVAIGLLFRQALVWIAIALSFVSLVQVMSLRLDEQLLPMSRGATAVMLLLFLALAITHAGAFYWAGQVTARAEAAQFRSCLLANGMTPDSFRQCRDANPIWILPQR